MTSQPGDGYGQDDGLYGPSRYQLRQPKGIPAGGQFAPTQNTESTLALDEAKGSFFYPSIPKSPEDLIDFWEEVTVPDAVLTRFQNGYQRRRAVWYEEEANRRSKKHMVQWELDNPEPEKKRFGSKEEHQGWASARNAAWARIDASVRSEVDVERPSAMSIYDTRPLLRAAQMCRCIRPTWSDEEKKRVLNHEIELSYGTRLVGNIEKGWRFSELYHLLDETSEDERRREERIRQQQHEELVEQLKDLEFEIKNLQKIQGIIAGYEK